MTTLISIDPGRKTGLAVFQNGTLENCMLYDASDYRTFALALLDTMEQYEPDSMIVEIPRVYQQRFWKGDPNKLIILTKIAGIAIGLFSTVCPVNEVFPQKWKGQRTKAADNRYTENCLECEELVILDKKKLPKSYKHNVLDAIGIGLWFLGRRNK